MTVDESRLAEWERLASEATPGPWVWANTAEKGYGANVGASAFAEDDDACSMPLSGDLSHRLDNYYVDEPIADMAHQKAASDAAFITAAREAVPALIAAVRELQAAAPLSGQGPQ